MPNSVPKPQIIDITESPDDTDFEGGKGVRMEPRLLFSPRPYSEERIVDDGNQHSGRLSLRDETSENVPVQRRRACLDRILEVFPDICHDHIGQLYENRPAEIDVGNDPSSALILKILDSGTYPKEKDRKIDLKRKREEEATDDEKEAATWEGRDRLDPVFGFGYYSQARQILGDEFPSTTFQFIEETLRTTGKNLFAAYATVERAERTFESYPNPPYRKLKKPRKSGDGVNRLSQTWLRDVTSRYVKISKDDIWEELQAARKRRIREDLKRIKEAELAAAEAANEKEHRDMGMMIECQCCFDDLPFNRTTHCNADEPHFFCLECARRNASNEIGQSRHKLCCMDSSGCKAEFQRAQIVRFLDDKTLKALDRIKQQDDIRLAELEDLVHCPFCDFAAICPPVDVDREFRCHNQECEKVSCRLCKQETHIPLSCEAYAKENKLLARHAVEEAMTEALLRSCNKCKESYVKEFGCNKMVCPKCRSMQCYVCSKTLAEKEGYNHFDGRGQAAAPNQPGKCPLFENTEQRQQEDIQKAEQAALAKVKADNPDMTEKELKIKFSDAVLRDDGRRLVAGGQPHVRPYLGEPRLGAEGEFRPVPIEVRGRINLQHMRDFAPDPMQPLDLVHGGRVIPDDPNLVRARQPAVRHAQPVVRIPHQPPNRRALRNDALPPQDQPWEIQLQHDIQLQHQIELQQDLNARQQARLDAHFAQYLNPPQAEHQSLRPYPPQQPLPAQRLGPIPTQAANNARQQHTAAREAKAATDALPFHPHLRDAENLRQAQQQPIAQVDQAIDRMYEDDYNGDDLLDALYGPGWRRDM
ncbi:MAG: hypothetical protein M1835_003946 [Candelina submexicana]|nr:MAG: hypothetical protein M1835_003946 [Candelina submexicana]